MGAAREMTSWRFSVDCASSTRRLATQNPAVWRQVKTPSAGFLDDLRHGVSRAIGWIALEICDLESVFPVLCVSLRIIRVLFPVESLVITGMIHVRMVDAAGVRCHNRVEEGTCEPCGGFSTPSDMGLAPGATLWSSNATAYRRHRAPSVDSRPRAGAGRARQRGRGSTAHGACKKRGAVASRRLWLRLEGQRGTQ